MALKDLLWVEKYRPSVLTDMILPKRIEDKLKNGVYQHLLFYGSPGCGKTTAAKILAKNYATLFINASVESGVDIVKNKITDFCQTISIIDNERKPKLIILDEGDGVSDQYMKALRGTIEQFHKTTRFILTCNHINKIPDNIQSRFECINFDFDDIESSEIEKKYFKRIYEIVKLEGMDIEKEALIELVKRKFPDLRSIITSLQAYSSEDKKMITLEDIKKYQGAFKDVYEMIFTETNPVKFYEYLVSNYSNRVDDVISTLGTDFLDYIKLEKPQYIHKIGEIAYEVNTHSYQLRFVIDPVVTMLSLAFKLSTIIRS